MQEVEEIRYNNGSRWDRKQEETISVGVKDWCKHKTIKKNRRWEEELEISAGKAR